MIYYELQTIYEPSGGCTGFTVREVDSKTKPKDSNDGAAVDEESTYIEYFSDKTELDLTVRILRDTYNL